MPFEHVLAPRHLSYDVAKMSIVSRQLILGATHDADVLAPAPSWLAPGLSWVSGGEKPRRRIVSFQEAPHIPLIF